jgi:surface polysaccharide O-acyltransferase-like enzyme
MLLSFPAIFPDLAGGALTWDDRVSVAGVGFWVARLLFDGSYPLLPWLSFAVLGGLLAELDLTWRRRVLSAGVLLSIGSVLFSGVSGTTWALTSGDALLTFFPASTAFLVVAATTVLAIHEFTLRATLPDEGLVNWISNLGRLSLTVYVLHFVPLAIYYRMVETPPSLLLGMVLTLAYVLIWIPIGNGWFEQAVDYSLEALLQRLTSQRP